MQQYTKAARELYGSGPFVPGGAWATRLSTGTWLILVATKDRWQDPSQLEWIEMGCEWLADVVAEYKIGSVAIPALGVGYGGLHWPDVLPILLKHGDIMAALNCDVDIYPPKPQPAKLRRANARHTEVSINKAGYVKQLAML